MTGTEVVMHCIVIQGTYRLKMWNIVAIVKKNIAIVKKNRTVNRTAAHQCVQCLHTKDSL